VSDDPVARAEAAEPIFPIAPVDLREIAELAQPGAANGFEDEVFTFPADSSLYEEVDDDEVNEGNWQDFLPNATPDLGILIDHNTGLLMPEEQAKYDQKPPEKQDSYEEGIGI